MKHIICSIYDSATQAYMRPFTAQTEGQAIRMFEDEAMRPESEIGKHPEDYALFKIGEFNDHEGLIISCNPTSLRRAHEIAPKVIPLQEAN